MCSWTRTWPARVPLKSCSKCQEVRVTPSPPRKMGSLTYILDFAAAPDSWHDIEVDIRFNSGLMVLKPSQTTFKDMMKKVTNPAFHPETEGDQAFLQNYWRYSYFGLPLRFNLNLILLNSYPTTWHHLWKIASVVHFTIRKPMERWEKPGHCHSPVSRVGGKEVEVCHEWMPLNVSLCCLPLELHGFLLTLIL